MDKITEANLQGFEEGMAAAAHQFLAMAVANPSATAQELAAELVSARSGAASPARGASHPDANAGYSAPAAGRPSAASAALWDKAIAALPARAGGG